mmetsp:Transcript_71860/g.206336  ORF Transcript_71860/g.206336 Transcript_71860/m.206336 type:complete len:210 (+) Transcript_71860:1254-1883(+)
MHDVRGLGQPRGAGGVDEAEIVGHLDALPHCLELARIPGVCQQRVMRHGQRALEWQRRGAAPMQQLDACQLALHVVDALRGVGVEEHARGVRDLDAVHEAFLLRVVVDHRYLEADLRHGQPPCNELGLVLHDHGNDVTGLEALLQKPVRHLVRHHVHVLEGQPPVLEDDEGRVGPLRDALGPDVGDGEVVRSLAVLHDGQAFRQALEAL